MGAAEAIIALIGKDQASPAISKVKGELGGLGTSGTLAAGGLGKLGTVASGVGGALGHAKSQVSGLISGMGVLAGGGALLGVSSLLGTSVSKANQFAESVDKLTGMTGQSAQTISQLVSGLDYFGVSGDVAIRTIGMLEKNQATQAQTAKKAATFNKEYGLSLVDSAGHLKDVNQMLLDSADYYNNKAIPAQTKALALSKLYGRQWQSLVEVFEAGSSKIRDAEQMAAQMGLTVNDQNIQSFIKLRDATRDWNTALGGLQLQIGLAVMPALADLAKAGATFVSTNRESIVGAIKGGIKFAEDFAGAVVKIGGAFKSVWDQIPGPLKELLVGGVVANKMSGWLFGTSPLKLGTNLLGNVGSTLLGGLLGKVPVVGGAAAQALGVGGTRVFVTNWPLSLGGNIAAGAGDVAGGAEGAAGAAAGGIGAGTIAAGAAAVVGGAVIGTAIGRQIILGETGGQSKGILDTVQQQAANQATTNQQLARSLLAMQSGQQQINSNIGTQFASLITGTNTNLDQGIASLTAELTARGLKIDPASLAALAAGTAHGAGSSPTNTRDFGLVATMLRDALHSSGKLSAGALLPSMQNLVGLFQSSLSPNTSSMASALKTLTGLQERFAAQGDTQAVAAIQQMRNDMVAQMEQLGVDINGLGPIMSAAASSAYLNSAAFQNYRQGERGDSGSTSVPVKINGGTTSPRENNNGQIIYRRVGGGSRVGIL